MTKFIFVRHGKTDYNVLVNSKLNCLPDMVPLSNEGEKQIEKLAGHEVFKDVDLILTSPYVRALQSAYILSQGSSVKVEVNINLHEWMPDLKYGYTAQDFIDPYLVRKIFFKAYADHLTGDKTDKEYESLDNAKERVANVMKGYLQYDKVIVVTHSSIISLFSKKDHEEGDIFEFEYNG